MVEQVDFVLSIRDGFNGDVVIVGSFALHRSSFVLWGRRRRVCRSVTGGSLPLRCHVA